MPNKAPFFRIKIFLYTNVFYNQNLPKFKKIKIQNKKKIILKNEFKQNL